MVEWQFWDHGERIGFKWQQQCLRQSEDVTVESIRLMTMLIGATELTENVNTPPICIPLIVHHNCR